MSTTETTTDMRTFEGALDECMCHLFPRINGIYVGTSWCGVPRSEQPEHGTFRSQGTHGPVCECGNSRCPECLRRDREAAR